VADVCRFGGPGSAVWMGDMAVLGCHSRCLPEVRCAGLVASTFGLLVGGRGPAVHLCSTWVPPSTRSLSPRAATGDVTDYGMHGTLCSASIAGSMLSDPWDRDSPITLGLATGVAPSARLSVVDFQPSWYAGNDIFVPDRVDLAYLPVSEWRLSPR
jgi:hypothetical protein